MDRHAAGSSADVTSWMSTLTTRECIFVFVSGRRTWATLTLPGSVFSPWTRTFLYFVCGYISSNVHQFQSCCQKIQLDLQLMLMFPNSRVPCFRWPNSTNFSWPYYHFWSQHLSSFASSHLWEQHVSVSYGNGCRGAAAHDREPNVPKGP